MRAVSIRLPDDETREIVAAELEPTVLDVRPDVLIHTPQGDVAIEIAVQHRTGEVKKARLAAMNLPAVEIDISIYRGVLMSEEELREAVLSTAARHWLKVRKEREKPASPRKPKDWVTHGYTDPDFAPDFDIPIPATPPPPSPHTPFVHYCHCGCWGAFGYGVDLRNGKEGIWYCAKHRREMMEKIVVP
jgi:hypothetical protein